MIKLVALLGLAAGGVVALGRLSTAQWHGIGVALLALTLAHGLTVLPWVLAALFALLWRKQRRRAWLYEQMTADGVEDAQRLRAHIWNLERAAERQPQRRKRA